MIKEAILCQVQSLYNIDFQCKLDNNATLIRHTAKLSDVLHSNISMEIIVLTCTRRYQLSSII